MEQIVDTAPVVPLLHTSEPQLVGSVVEVQKIFDNLLPDVEQVIEVPKIILHTAPQVSSLLEPQMGGTVGASAWVEFVFFRRYEGALGLGVVRACWGTRGSLRVHDTGWGDTASPWLYTNTGHR